MSIHIPDRTMSWLGPAVILLTGSVLIFGNPIGLDMVCSKTQNCVVTWVGALSGWVAAIAAFFTVQAMMAIQRENVDIQLHARVTLVRVVKRRADMNRRRIERLRRLRRLAGVEAVALTAEEAKDIRRLSRSFNNRDFEDFERVEFVGATYLTSVRSRLTKVVEYLDIYRGDANGTPKKNVIWPDDFETINIALIRAEKHNNRIRKASERFTNRWTSRGISF